MPDFQEHAEEIAEKYLEALGHTRAYITRLNFDGGNSIEIEYEVSYCGCCPPDHETERMPIHFLWDEKARETEIDAIIEKRRIEKEREEQERKRRAEEAQRKTELAQLERLKAKYEKEG